MAATRFKCPICSRPAPRDLATFPFCSERCRLVDLGEWLTGGYRIEPPGHGADSDDEQDGPPPPPPSEEDED